MQVQSLGTRPRNLMHTTIWEPLFLISTLIHSVSQVVYQMQAENYLFPQFSFLSLPSDLDPKSVSCSYYCLHVPSSASILLDLVTFLFYTWSIHTFSLVNKHNACQLVSQFSCMIRLLLFKEYWIHRITAMERNNLCVLFYPGRNSKLCLSVCVYVCYACIQNKLNINRNMKNT